MDRIRSGLVLLLISGGAAAHAQGAADSIVVMPQDIVWKAPPVGPGPATAVTFGDPTKPGPYVLRVKFPAGFKLMPHIHPDEWRRYRRAVGRSKLKVYPPGTFYSEPKGTPHFVWTKDGEVIVQITAMRPTGVTRIPQKQQ